MKERSNMTKKVAFCDKHRAQGWELCIAILSLPVDVPIKKHPASIQKMVNGNCPNHLRNSYFR